MADHTSTSADNDDNDGDGETLKTCRNRGHSRDGGIKRTSMGLWDCLWAMWFGDVPDMSFPNMSKVSIWTEIS